MFFYSNFATEVLKVLLINPYDITSKHITISPCFTAGTVLPALTGLVVFHQLNQLHIAFQLEKMTLGTKTAL